MAIKTLKKHSEFTYGVHKETLLKHVPDNLFSLFNYGVLSDKFRALEEGMMGSVRSLNNEFELLRQAIAYGIHFKQVEGKFKFLVYMRNKLNSEKELTQVLSLAPGGHVDRYDLAYHHYYPDKAEYPIESETLDFERVMANNWLRETQEEVTFGKFQGTETKVIGFVMDSKPKPGYVGNVHFGVVFATEHESDAVFEMKENMNDTVGWLSVEELISRIKGINSDNEPVDRPGFEPWSKLIIERIEDLQERLNQ